MILRQMVKHSPAARDRPRTPPSSTACRHVYQGTFRSRLTQRKASPRRSMPMSNLPANRCRQRMNEMLRHA